MQKIHHVICSIIFLFIISAGNVCAAQQSYNVLFIGNSLTSANNIPKLLADLARSKGHSIDHTLYVRGGRRLMQHASDARLLELIRSQKWDYVFLQGQSQYPAFSENQVRRDVFPYARALSDAIKSAYPSTKIVFYQTMAHKNGDPNNIKVSLELGSYEGMQKRINQTYKTMASENGGILAPVGTVWQKVRQQRPDIQLYADIIHPNLTGSYLVACVFYKVIFRESTQGLPVARGVVQDSALKIQQIVDQVVVPYK